jgi:hypothetical protein
VNTYWVDIAAEDRRLRPAHPVARDVRAFATAGSIT